MAADKWGDTEELKSNLTAEEVEKLASEILVDEDDGMIDIPDDLGDMIVVEE